MESLATLFSIIILIVSIVFHELAHGTMADRLGDPTPRLMGRLTLNPLAHLDWVGSFILPLLCIISGSGFIIGWAKPVPFNPSHLKNRRWGPALVAWAGPLVNGAIALGSSLLLHLSTSLGISETFSIMLYQVIAVNVALFLFNLIPLPPLDGYHIFGALFPQYRVWAEKLMEGRFILIMFLVIFMIGPLMGPLINWLTTFLITTHF